MNLTEKIFFRKVLALFIMLFLISGLLAALLIPVFGAAAPIKISIESYSEGELSIRWSSVPRAQAAKIEYHEPGTNNSGTKKEILTESTNTATILGLKNDYIYDIFVKVYDNESATGEPIAQGLLYFIPEISFYSEQVKEPYTEIPGGGRETGDKPRLNLRWAVPKIYNSAYNTFIDADNPEAISSMKNKLNSIYGPETNISSLNYRINISTDSSKLNAGSAQASVLINYKQTGYKANVSGKDSIAVGVKRNTQGLHEYMNFDLIGKSSPNADTPQPEEYGLPDDDILPGTVYYMNIKPVFKNDKDEQVAGVTVGAPLDQNGSKLSGEFDYTYTSIRFQITRDYANNVYFRIYKVNDGSLNLPRLYYQIQASDDPTIDDREWVVKKTMDDTYFSGEYALTAITGISPNNEIHYKIVVKSERSNDRLESLSMPYILYQDTGRPPVPTGVIVEKREHADITISWDKPLNWNDIKNNTDPNEDIVYHILLNTSQSEIDIQPNPPLEAEGKNYGNFPLKYRLVKHVSSKELIEDGDRLKYTMKGFELFKGTYFTGNDVDGKPSFEKLEIENEEGYPNFLLPNTVYYFQMYTTKGEHKGSIEPEHTSDRSLTTSFTTLAQLEREVPLVKNFSIKTNSADIEKDPITGEIEKISNYVEIQFEKPYINWKDYTHKVGGQNKDYYDLYMSTRPLLDSFVFIGSTEPAADYGDVKWSSQQQSSVVLAKINKFSEGTPGYTAFGAELRPNTTYYFMIKTRLSIEGSPKDLTSESAVFLPVTTVKGPVKEPDYSARKPLAPTDFAIAQDENGNFLVSGSRVTFQWSKLEQGVKYELVCTSERVLPETGQSELESDPLYRKIILDPEKDIAKGYFEYIETKNEYRFTLDKGLFPNKIYYFSLKAIKNSDNKDSYWVSIPVTTTLIDSPIALEVVGDYQISFFWEDRTAGVETHNFKVYIKKFGDYDYKLLNKTQYTFTKDGNFYYGRIKNLEPNSSYSVKVYEKEGASTPMLEKGGLTTRDEFHEIDVRWKGLKSYKYELAIKSESQDDYTILRDANLMEYTNSNGQRLPYYIEGTEQVSGMEYGIYYARIKRTDIRLPNGNISSLPLKSDTKYYIKVRSVKEDSFNIEAVAKSRYEGPVSTRTEYNQKDYEEDNRQEEYKDLFLKKVKELEEKYYWRILGDSQEENSILLKEDRVINAIRNSSSLSYDIDIAREDEDVVTDTVYIPMGVLEEIRLQNKTLSINVLGAEYLLRPGSIEFEGTNGIKQLMGKLGVKDVLVKVSVTEINGEKQSLPYSTQTISQVSDMKIQALGISKDQKEIRELVYNRLYNKDTGLVNQMLGSLFHAISGIGPEAEKFIEDFVYAMAGIFENELAFYISNTLDLITPYKLNQGKFSQDISNFSSKVMVKMYYANREEKVMPYASFNNGKSWVEMPLHAANRGYVTFETARTGSFIVLNVRDRQQSVSDDVAVERTWKNIGLDEIVDFKTISRGVSRQELAVTLMRFYCVRMGIDMDSYRFRRNIYIADENDISSKYYKAVAMSLEYEIMELKGGGNFDPSSMVSQKELKQSLDKLQKILE